MSYTMPDLPTLHGPRVTLRPLIAGEAQMLAQAIAADPNAGPRWHTDVPTLLEWFSGEIEGLLAIEFEGEPVGIIDFEENPDPQYKAAGMDIAILSSHAGKGLGPEALRALAAWLIDVRGHHRLTIDPAADNAHAIHTYEKLGYRPIGIARCYEQGPDGTWHDSLLMDMLAEEFVRA